MRTSPIIVIESLDQVCKAGGAPLSARQKTLLAGSLSAWLEKVRREGLGAGLEASDQTPTDAEGKTA